MSQLLVPVSFIAGCIVTAVLIRYSMSLGTNIVRRTQDGLPAFGKDDPIMTQIRTDGTEEENEYEE